MPMDNGQTTDPFEIVIANLVSQRDRIDQTITVLRQLHVSGFADAGAALAGAQALATPLDEIKPPNDSMGPGAFLGMTIVDAAKKLLTNERRQLTNQELVEGLQKGGLVIGAVDKLNTVGSVMNRRFQQVGDIVRISRGTWGLKEWYPNRSFKTAIKAPENAAVEESTEQSSISKSAAILAAAVNASIPARSALSRSLMSTAGQSSVFGNEFIVTPQPVNSALTAHYSPPLTGKRG